MTLSGPANPRRPAPREQVEIVEALVLLAVSFILLQPAAVLFARLGLGIFGGTFGGIFGMIAAELLIVLLPSLLFLRHARIAPGPALGLTVPPIRAFALALVIGAGAFYFVSGGVDLLQSRALPLPPALKQQFHDLLLPPSGPRPLALDLLALALVPAVCEELLFRGVLLRALLRFDRTAALLFSSLAFGAFHGSLFKLLPTAAIGLLLALLALRSASLLPSMLAHAANNTLVIALYRVGYEDPPGAASPLAPIFLLVSLMFIGGGLFFVRPRSPSE